MADRYWVGGTGDWNDTAHWSASSGGASGASVPTPADDAFFDANSSAVSYTVNLLALSVSFRNFSVPAKPATGELTISGSGASANIYGAVSVDVGVVAGSMLGQLVNFYGTTSIKIPPGMYLARTCYIQSGTLTFQSNLQMLLNWSSTFYRVGASSVDANGYKLTMYSDPASARGITGDMTLHDLEIIGGGYFNFNGNVTGTGTLTIPGLAANAHILVASGALGTQKTIAFAAAALGYVHFMDIAGAGAAAPFTGTSLGDCLGNSGITFTPAADQYFYAPTPGTKAWSSAGNWFLGSGGTGGAGRVPLPQDNVIFDANSIGAAGVAITSDMPRLGKDISFAGVTNAPVWNVSSGVMSVFGSITAPSGMTMSIGASLLLSGRSNHTLNISATPVGAGTLYVYAFGGTYTLTAALAHNGPLNLYTGAFSDAGCSVAAASFDSSNSFARTLNATGAWTITGSGSCWNLTNTTNLTVVALPSSIKLTNAAQTAKVFAGGGKAYNTAWFNSATRFQITGNNSYGLFKADPYAILQLIADTIQTAATWDIDGREATGSDAPCVRFDGAFGSNLTTLNSAALQALVGDIDVDFDYSPDLWAAGTNSQVIGNMNQSSGTSGWRVLKVAANAMRFDYSNGATVVAGVTATVAANTNGTFYRYRIKRIAATGMQTWYRSDDDGASWTPIAGPTAGATGNMAAPTLPLTVGESNVSGFNWAGRLKSARVYAGDRDAGGVLIASPDPALWTTGNTFTAATGEVWTRAGNAQFTATNLTTIMGVTNATYTLAKSGGGVVACRNLSIRNATASPAATFYAGAASFDGGGNTNWLWQDIAMLSGDAAAAAAASGALDAGIALAGVSLSVAGAGGTLTTAIPLAAAAVAVSAAEGILNAQITLSGAALAEAAAAAGLDTGIPLDGLAGGAAAASGTLTVQIVLAGDAAAAAGAGGDLTAQVQLSAVAIAQAVASGSLTTEIPLAAFAQAQASVVADFVTRPRIRGYRLEATHARRINLISRDARIAQ